MTSGDFKGGNKSKNTHKIKCVYCLGRIQFTHLSIIPESLIRIVYLTWGLRLINFNTEKKQINFLNGNKSNNLQILLLISCLIVYVRLSFSFSIVSK